MFCATNTEVLFGNSVTEANLKAYRSTDGDNFSQAGGTVDTNANTVTVNGVTQLKLVGAG